MRLIDVDAMEKFMSDTVLGDIRGYPYSDTLWETAFKWLDNQPTVDAIQAVRCRECQYAREPDRQKRAESVACEGTLICCIGFNHVYPSSTDGMIFVNENAYCSDGKRRAASDES